MATTSDSGSKTSSLLKKKEEDLDKKEKELQDKLSKVSRISVEEAKKMLLNSLQKDLTEEIAKKIRAAEERVRLESAEIAKEILVDAMKHGATSYTAEYTVSSVSVPNADVKGRIIGAGGRNIRSFEKEAGVEIEI